MKVLLVQEKPFIATALKLTLLSKGYDLILSTNIHDPHSVIEHVNPNIVITDVSEGKGMSFVEEAKRKNVPVIVLSENGKEDYLQSAFDKGADDYMCIPLSLSELALRVSLLTFGKANAVA